MNKQISILILVLLLAILAIAINAETHEQTVRMQPNTTLPHNE